MRILGPLRSEVQSNVKLRTAKQIPLVSVPSRKKTRRTPKVSGGSFRLDGNMGGLSPAVEDRSGMCGDSHLMTSLSCKLA